MSDQKNILTIPYSEIKLDSSTAIGSGANGHVYRAEWRGVTVAVKKAYYKDFTLSIDLIKNSQNEATLLAQCDSSYIIKVYGIHVEEKYLYIVMEYFPKGSLRDVLLNHNETLNWNFTRRHIAIDIGQGISYLHRHNILHCDLTSSNVLLTTDYHAKIIDLGKAVKLAPDNNKIKRSLNELGTIRHLSPETLLTQIVDKACDIYSYGMALWEIASRKIPFARICDKQILMDSIAAGMQETLPNGCPLSFWEIIQKCWKAPQQRPPAEAIVFELVQIVLTENEINNAMQSNQEAILIESEDATYYNLYPGLPSEQEAPQPVSYQPVFHKPPTTQQGSDSYAINKEHSLMVNKEIQKNQEQEQGNAVNNNLINTPTAAPQ